MRLARARAIVDDVVANASGPVSVFVADAHGELVAAATMDGAAPDTRLNAQRKAYTAARSDATSTRELAEKARADPVERASFDPFFTFFLGGIAVFEDGRRVGAVGVSGLPGELDEQLALAAIERTTAVSRAVANIKSDRPVETRDFFVDLLGFEVAMDLGWVLTVASPTNRSAQVTIISNDDPAAPGISVEVADVDAVHARAEEKGFEIAYPLRDEEWGVRRFMLREPSGTTVNVLSHRSG